MSDVIDFAEYKRLQREKDAAELLAAFEAGIVARIMQNPLGFLRDMAARHDSLHESLREIIEASRRQLPAVFFAGAAYPTRPSFNTVNIPMEDYERLKRLDDAVAKAERKHY